MTRTLIHNGFLIDGRGGPPVADAAVLLEDNFIKNAGPEVEIADSVAPHHTIDVGGGFILPGLIDTHVHITLEGVNPARDMLAPFSMRFYNATQYLRRTLEAGITSVRDAGGADAGVRQAVRSGVVPGPRLQISVKPLTITGGHGDHWMLSGESHDPFPTYPGSPDGICDGVAEVRKKTREMLRAGADVIKVHATGGVLSPSDRPEFVQFSPEELEVIVHEAAYHAGKKVMAHAQGAEGIKNAIRAGVHSIEHGIFLDGEAIDLMLDKGTFLVPTLLAPLAVLEIGEEGGLPPYALPKARELLEIHRQNIRRAHRAGVRIAMGTDAGVMPHGTNLRELGLMTGVGLTPMEALVATTKTAAECLGWDDRLGTVEAGKLADIVVTRTDPLANIRTLEESDNITLVIQDGRLAIDRRADFWSRKELQTKL